jgi:hypothetical protein
MEDGETSKAELELFDEEAGRGTLKIIGIEITPVICNASADAIHRLNCVF